MNQDIKISLADDGVLEIVLKRSDEGNTLTLAMTEILADTAKALPKQARMVLLRSEGEDFCIGRQSPMPPPESKPTVSELRHRVAEPVLDFYAAFRDIPVPVICIVQGRALGVGCALAGLADLTIATEEATFGIPEMNRDIPPTLVMAALADRISRASLARLVFTRDPISATEASQVGLIGWVVSAEKVESEVKRIRMALMQNSDPVLRAVKGFLGNYSEASRATLRELAASLNAAAVSERFNR